jgi:hypothetical protein
MFSAPSSSACGVGSRELRLQAVSGLVEAQGADAFRGHEKSQADLGQRLQLGRNPMLVAKEHGHRVLTVLTVYAAWVDGAVETDIVAIRRAMYHPPSKVSKQRAGSKAEPETNSSPTRMHSAPDHTASRSSHKACSHPGLSLTVWQSNLRRVRGALATFNS